MPKRPIKNRLIPYKILVLLEHGQFTWLTREPNQLRLRLGPMSRSLRISSSRLREQLDWLLSNRYLTSLSVKYGEAVVSVRPPLAAHQGGPPSQESK